MLRSFEGLARLVGGVLAAGVSVWLGAPLDAQELSLQTSLEGRLYVLVDEKPGWTMVEPGAVTTELPAGREVRFEALAAVDDGWLLAGQRMLEDGSGRELVLLRGGGEHGVETLPTPPAGRNAVRSMQPLVEKGKLVGMAWLEGEDPGALGVRAASFSNGGFAAAEWVAPPAEGSQLALSAAVLDDGSWLLVWSSFDGTDDEIVWSWRESGTWTEPARVHADDRVPDITPVVAATGGGAVCAWSAYEQGSYRVQLSRFRSGSWSGEERVGGAGSVFPFFVAENDAPYLVFPEVSADRWLLLALDRDGRVMSRSRWRGPLREKPLVRAGAAGAMGLEWPRLPTARGPGGF